MFNNGASTDGCQSLPNLSRGTKAHYDSLPQEELDEYVEKLKAHKIAKGTGVRVSSKSKLMDIRHTTGHIEREVSCQLSSSVYH